MDILPHEVSLNILSRLPVGSIIDCKRVCRSWRGLANDPHLPLLYQDYHRNNSCLLLHSSVQDQLYLIHNYSELDTREGNIKRIDMAPHARFSSVLYCNGLLCLSYTETRNYSHVIKTFVYDPSTEEITTLPDRMTKFSYKEAYGFGFLPKTKQYKVVRVVEYDRVVDDFNLNYKKLSTEQSIEVFTLGQSVWNEKRIKYFWIRIQPSEALISGVLHWLGQQENYAHIIVGLDLMDEEFRQIPMPRCRFHADGINLMVLGGCLSVMFYEEGGERVDIWLMKDYGMESSWTPEFAIRPDASVCTRLIRPLCILKNGKILMEYSRRELICYDPEERSYKKLNIHKLPDGFQAVPHVDSIINLALRESI